MNSKCVATVCVVALIQAVVKAQTTWIQAAAAGPGARAAHAMVYDSARARTVMFGGNSSGNLVNDTWEWDGTGWSQVATTGPLARQHHSMAYDSLRARTVLFGGGGAGYLGDTWEWDGSTWTQVATTGPSARSDSSMTYDSLRGRTVLFGGITSGGRSGETWEWDGTTWTQVASNGPSVRSGASLAYDSLRGRTVLFGGYGGGGSPALCGDTWEWNGTSWSQVASTGPSARNFTAVAYDSLRARTVLFGGSGLGGSALGDTWAWDGTGWLQVVTPGPLSRHGHSMAYDQVRARTVLFGGLVAFPNMLGDTWEMNPAGIATAQTYGTGCGSPAIAIAPRTASRPIYGQTQVNDIVNVPFGFAAVAWGITKQSLPLDFAGINGCTLLSGAEIEISSFCQSTSFSTAQHSLAIPHDVALLGLHLYLQAWSVAPGFNPLGIAMSNGVELAIGDI